MYINAFPQVRLLTEGQCFSLEHGFQNHTWATWRPEHEERCEPVTCLCVTPTSREDSQGGAVILDKHPKLKLAESREQTIVDGQHCAKT